MHGPWPVGLTGDGITCSPVNEVCLLILKFKRQGFEPAHFTVFPECSLLGYSCGLCPPGYSGAGTRGPDLAYALTHQPNVVSVNSRLSGACFPILFYSASDHACLVSSVCSIKFQLDSCMCLKPVACPSFVHTCWCVSA